MTVNSFKNRKFNSLKKIQLYCCSPYDVDGIDSVGKLDDKHCLIFDSNISIYIRNLFYELKCKQISDLGVYKEIVKVLHLIYKRVLQVDYSFGLQESCRRLDDFSLNFEKFNQSIKVLEIMTNNSLQQVVQKINTFNVGDEIKDYTQRTNSKLDSAKKLHDD